MTDLEYIKSVGTEIESIKAAIAELEYIKAHGDERTEFVPTREDLEDLADWLADFLIAHNYNSRSCVDRSLMVRLDYASYRLGRILKYLPDLEPQIQKKLLHGYDESGVLWMEYEALQRGETKTRSE